jgi:hypothetical protein
VSMSPPWGTLQGKRKGHMLMDVPKQVAKLCQGLAPDKQEEVLDFVEFLVSRQVPMNWTVEKRQEAVARTMGCLSHTRTSSEAFAQRKQDEKSREERRWKP